MYYPASDAVSQSNYCLPAPGLNRSLKSLVINTYPIYHFSYDIIGLIFWMLSRCEEVSSDVSILDSHQRFPGTASHAYRFNYLHRPIVDEWINLLRQFVQRIWPNINLNDFYPEVFLSHDVDSVSAFAFVRRRRFLRVMSSQLIKNFNSSALLAPLIRYQSRNSLSPLDPYNTFDWIMDRSEEIGLRSSFFFISGRTDAKRDAHYDISHPTIRKLIRHISQRGHQIGLHPSYQTFATPSLIVKEALHLREVCAEEGVSQSIWGGRMHVLRWQHPTTAYGWEDANFDYDSTLMYADQPGFRAGTYPYRMYDPQLHKQLILFNVL